MKVLSLTTERTDANAVASALRSSLPTAKVTWAARFEDAARWIRDNRDVEVLVLDARLGAEAGGSFVEHLRRHGLSTPAIVVTSSDADVHDTEGAWRLSPRDCVLTRAGLADELASAVTQVTELAAHAPASSPDPAAVSRLAQLQAAVDQAARARQTEAKAAAARLDKQARAFAASLGDLTKRRAALEHRVRDLETRIEQLQEERTHEAQDSAARQREMEVRLADEIAQRLAACEELEAVANRLQETDAELRHLRAEAEAWRQRLTTLGAVAQAAESARDREAAALADLSQRHDQQIEQLTIERQHAEQERAAADDAASRLLAREAQLTEDVERLTAERDRLAEALGQSQQDYAEAQASAAHAQLTAADAHDALEARLASERSRLAQDLDREANARQDAEAAVARVERERSALQQRFDEVERTRHDLERQLDAVHVDCRALEAQLATVEAALQDAHTRHTSELARTIEEAGRRLALREGELQTLLDHEVEQRLALESAVARGERDQREAREQHVAALAQAASQMADREAQFQVESVRADEVRCTLEQRLAEAEAATASAQHALTEARAELAAAAERLASRERELTDLSGSRDRLREALTEAHAATREACQRELIEQSARQQASERQTALESQLETERVRREAVEHERDALVTTAHANQQEMDRLRVEHHHALLQAERQIAEVEAHQTELIAQHGTAEQAHERALSQLRDGVAAAATLHQAEVEHVRADRTRVARDLDDVTRELAAVRADADRRFDEHPQPSCVCTFEGVPVRANRAFAALLGCGSEDRPRLLDAAASVFSSSGDVSWLLQRMGSHEVDEPIQAVWKNAHGGRVVVRLSAAATPDGAIIVAQDITEQTVLQERLERTRRMEAVGRLAAELAATCQANLEEVRRGVQGCLGTVEGQPSQKMRVELILSDVATVIEQLRRLHAYAESQAAAVEPVDLHRSLRSLESLLKEVAGDDIELVLPRRSWLKSNRLYVDVREERVERVLINVAAYARQRMPRGGVVSFELQTVQVDRAFVDQHPSARPGPHALLIVKETQDRPRALRAVKGPDETAHVAGHHTTGEPASVDLGALRDVVSGAGGHLWVEATPGHLTIQVHLPAATPEERRWSPVSLVFQQGA